MTARVLIDDVYRLTGVGPVPVGLVKEGVLKIGMDLEIEGTIMTVKSIEMHHKQIQEAKEGDDIGMTLANADYNLLKGKIRTEAFFSGEGVISQTPIEPETTKPEGAFSFLKKIFGK